MKKGLKFAPKGIYFVFLNIYLIYFLGKKNVMGITSTLPILGKTVDDDRAKPAIFKRYDNG